LRDEASGTQAGEKVRPESAPARPVRRAEESAGRVGTLSSLAGFLLTNEFYPLAPGASRASPQVVQKDELQDEMIAGEIIR
jgi:hypothetical protein